MTEVIRLKSFEKDVFAMQNGSLRGTYGLKLVSLAILGKPLTLGDQTDLLG